MTPLTEMMQIYIKFLLRNIQKSPADLFMAHYSKPQMLNVVSNTRFDPSHAPIISL